MSSKCGTAMVVELCLRAEAEFGGTGTGPVWANAAADKRPQIRNKPIARRIQQSSPEVHGAAFSPRPNRTCLSGGLMAEIKVWQEAVVVFSLHRYDVLHRMGCTIFS